MRLPWPFGRRSPSDGPSPAEPEGASPSAPSAPRDLTAPPTGAWTSLPPIQRTAGDAPLVAPSAPFLDEVPGHRPLPPIVQALGHESGPSAPPGLVLAKPSAVPSLTSHAPMPVQRRSAATSPAVPEVWSEPEPAAERATVRRLPAIAASATVTPSPVPLTQAPAVTRPVAQRSTGGGTRSPSPVPGATPAGARSPVGVESPVLPAPRATGPARVSRWAEHPTADAVSPGLGPPLPSAPAGVPSPPAGSPASRATAGATGATAAPTVDTVQRRAGLGSPMTTAPATSVSRRLPMTLAPGSRPTPAEVAQARAASPALSPLPADVAAMASAAGHDPRPLPVLAVSRRVGASPAPAGGTSADDRGPAAQPDPVRRDRGTPSGSTGATVHSSHNGPVSAAAGPAPATASASAVRPTLGLRPLRTSIEVQRDARDAGAGHHAEPAAPGPVAARWPSGGDLPATIEALPRTWTGEDPVPLRQLESRDPSPVAAAPGDPPAMREIVFPAPGTPAAMAPGTGAASSGSPVIQRSAVSPVLPTRHGMGPAPRAAVEPALNLARPGVPATGHAATGSGSAGAPLQPRVDPPSAGIPAPVVQTTRPGPSTVPDISVTPVIQRIDGSAPTTQAGPGGGARSDRELDELAQALFGRLRTRLRTEVIHEREARGLGFDAF